MQCFSTSDLTCKVLYDRVSAYDALGEGLLQYTSCYSRLSPSAIRLTAVYRLLDYILNGD